MTATEQFIDTLQSLKAGDLGRLRKLAGLSLDESVEGFDLFAGLWWPLREKSQRAPRREVAWIVAKLYAFCPMPQVGGQTLPAHLGRVRHGDERAAQRWQRRVDEMLLCPLNQIEPALQWAIRKIKKTLESLRAADAKAGLDWVRLTDDLSFWEREEIRLKWAKQYLQVTD
jgi:CRISPR type I-E-associated protein CasB/Cse2